MAEVTGRTSLISGDGVLLSLRRRASVTVRRGWQASSMSEGLSHMNISLSWDSQVIECFGKLYRNSAKLYQIFWKHKSRFVSVRNQRCRLLTKGDSPMTSLHNIARSVSLFSMFLHDSSRFSRCSMAA